MVRYAVRDSRPLLHSPFGLLQHGDFQNPARDWMLVGRGFLGLSGGRGLSACGYGFQEPRGRQVLRLIALQCAVLP